MNECASPLSLSLSLSELGLTSYCEALQARKRPRAHRDHSMPHTQTHTGLIHTYMANHPKMRLSSLSLSLTRHYAKAYG